MDFASSSLGGGSITIVTGSLEDLTTSASFEALATVPSDLSIDGVFLHVLGLLVISANLVGCFLGLLGLDTLTRGTEVPFRGL